MRLAVELGRQISRLLLMFVFLLGAMPVLAQDSAVRAVPRTGVAVDSVRRPAAGVPPSASATDTIRHPSQKIIPEIKKNIGRYPIYFIFLFVGGFVLLALIRILQPEALRDLVLAAASVKTLLNLFREGRFGFTISNVLLDVLTIMGFSFFIQEYVYPGDYALFPWVVAYTCIGYILKLIFIQFLAGIFLGRSEAMVHLLQHMLFTRVCGMLLLPILFAGFYQTAIPVRELLQYTGIFLLAFYGFWLIRLFVKMQSMSISGLFYLFLYLCTVEVSPLLILLKGVVQ